MSDQDCIHGKTLDKCDLCEAVKYCLDYPEDAAQELLQLRQASMVPWMVVTFLAGALVGLWFG